MEAISTTIGFLMLVLGRQFYAFFVGGYGFLASSYLLTRYHYSNSLVDLLVTSLLIGLFTGLASLILKRWLAVLACFVAGGFALFNLPQVLGGNPTWLSWQLFLMVGLICVALTVAWFDFMVIVLSVVSGAVLIVENVKFGDINQLTMLILMLGFGLAVQFVLLQYGHSSPD
jgi:hypothetical protein